MDKGPSVDVRTKRAFGADELGTVRFGGAQSFQVVEIEKAVLEDAVRLHRLGLRARTYGAAERTFQMVVDYAKERKQFGKAIGGFQAIQHKLANNQIALTVTRLGIANAAAQFDRRHPDWRVQAAAACTFAQSAFRHRNGRRTREELAIRFLDEGQGLPEYGLGPKANALWQEVRNWLEVHRTEERRQAMLSRPNSHREYDEEFARDLDKTGWLSLNWREEYGGRNCSALEYLAFVETMEAEAPRAGAAIQAVSWLLFGRREQKRRYLPELRLRMRS